MSEITIQKNLSFAYDFYNKELFNNELPKAFIVLNRKRNAHGYFWQGVWEEKNTKEHYDEISLNPETFSRSEKEVLSTLVHEMCHLKQQHFGKPSRSGYHNKQFADFMEEVGLIASSTGEEGGKRTGQNMTHYIEVGGKFEEVTNRLLNDNKELKFNFFSKIPVSASKQTSKKVKYVCPKCASKVWGKGGLFIECMDCNVQFNQEG